MNTPLLPSQLAWLVPLAALAIGIAFGAIAQATRFCTMGALSDLFSFGDATRLRMWLAAIAVALVSTQLAIVTGTFDLTAAVYAGPRVLWASTLVGGSLFGFGMVLASGCASKCLIRTGGGSIKAMIVLSVMGIFALMTLRGVLAEVRVALLDRWFIDLSGTQDVPALIARALNGPMIDTRWVVVGIVVFGLASYVGRDRSFVTSRAMLGALAIGALVFLGWLVTAHLGYLPEHPDTLEPAWIATNSRRPESLSFVTPVAYGINLMTLWSDRNTTVTFGIATAGGVLMGAMASALIRKEFRWETFTDLEDTANHLAGAALMGFGGVTALGCTIGQGISGLSTLSLGSFLAVTGIVAGAWCALRYQTWRIENSLAISEVRVTAQGAIH